MNQIVVVEPSGVQRVPAPGPPDQYEQKSIAQQTGPTVILGQRHTDLRDRGHEDQVEKQLHPGHAAFAVRVCRPKAWRLRKGLWQCRVCRRQVSVTAGTVIDTSHLPLQLWFRAMWQMTSQKNGISALGLQRVLGLGSYKTAWAMLHKLRRAMVRPGRDCLEGRVEVDETYVGGEGKGKQKAGRGTDAALVAIAVEEDGSGMGRIRMARIADESRTSLYCFIRASIQPGSTALTWMLSLAHAERMYSQGWSS